ncbi:hypothetical protein [Proteus vulgaris]|uniref:hypothetical protein n=1 Tax=Proteus vulgaris TaxID=585 RepID=UPI0018C6C500|nr:hypothetical protein [Proteus mirabilis]
MSVNQINYDAIGRDVYLSRRIHSLIKIRQCELKHISVLINEYWDPYSDQRNEYMLFDCNEVPALIESIQYIDNQLKELLPEQNKWAKIAGGEPIVIEGLNDVR